MEDREARLAALAERQHGLITFADARTNGLGARQIQRRAASGRWARVTRGVYRVNGAPVTWRQEALARCLAAPDAAAVTHLTAACVASFWDRPPPVPHLTVPMGRSHRLPGAVVHRARLGPTETVLWDGIPITTPARTLIDCAALLGPRQLQRLVDEAFHRRLVTAASIEHAWDLARLRPGRAGERKLREAIEPWSTRVRPGSPAEVRLAQLVQQWGLPEPELQIPVLGPDGSVVARIDFGWSPVRIGVEYDSERFHGPSRWAADADRHRVIEACGWRLLHADRTDLTPGRGSLRRDLELAWAEARAA